MRRVKVENIQEDSLNLIKSPSPSVKVQNNVRQSLLEGNKGNDVKYSFCLQKFVDNAQQCFAFTT